jgi:hypothetical protein
MNNHTETQGEKVVYSYATYGLFGGLLFGLLIGLFISGPNFAEWSALRSVLVIFGSGFVGGLLGYVLPSLAVGSTAGGSGAGVYSSDSFSDGGTGAHDSGGCDSGGDSGDGGGCGGGDA